MVTQILDDNDRAAIEDALERISLVEQEVARARAANLDVTALEQRLTALRDKLTAIRSAFFPNR